ncbi:MAG: hypothetical protein A2622_05855 [Bdellovibrionales bacterium RIFCSPHIGHO2_01_FULL_40_29]|nr:MAG: hypothetical protein A2622_05855 [Bdellovibrionales bacterium RIFCSPHIGHO2_01_FULL_40_29]OFZ34977.1 MAG: hypothetical protein A3D17_06205 [Bdellovibrionales bacterium RIFCSPHIGHO2_02_FULL_40_15]
MRTFLKTIIPVLFIATTTYADKIIVMADPLESLQARIELIMTAKKSIDVQYFTVEHDYVSISGLALLREAARRGVKIRVIVDSMHNLMTRETMSAFMNNLDASTEKNIEIREFNQFNIFRPFCYTRRMHDKSLIIDGEYLIVGDRNVASGYYDIPERVHNQTLPAYEGTDVLLSGTKSINEAKNYFEQRWNSRDVKSVQLYNYSSSRLDYSYCSYREDFSACEMNRQHDVQVIQKEIQKLDSHYADVAARNTQLLKERPFLKALETAYETNDVQFIHDDAAQRVCKGKNPEKNIGKTLYQAIAANTKSDLIIVTPYLTVTPEMEALIKHLVEDKNIFVRFITNSPISTDVSAATAGYLKTRHRLMNIKNASSGRGVRIYEFTNISNPTLKNVDGSILKSSKAVSTLHAKMVLMDSERAFIGSYNWDYRSQNLNSEVGVVIGMDKMKKNQTTEDLRNFMTRILKTSKIVRDDGTSNDKVKVTEVLTEDEQVEINSIIKSREEVLKLWNFLLELPVVGELLLEQT